MMRLSILGFGILELLACFYNWKYVEQILKPTVTLLMIYDFLSKTQILTHNNPINLKIYNKFKRNLFYCLLGDIALLYEQRHPVFFQLGMLFFSIGHLHQIIMNIRLIGIKGLLSGMCLLSGCLVGSLAKIGWNQLADSLPQDLYYPVTIYLILIGVMIWLNLSRTQYGIKGLTYSTIGAILFAISDFTIGCSHFRHESNQYTVPFIMLTYYMAQYLMALGVYHTMQFITIAQIRTSIKNQ